MLFDQYQLARAVAKFPVPVITGIGHQKNETLADLMAHTATKTPTQAAEFILHHNRSFERRILELRQSITLQAGAFLAKTGLALASLNGRLVHRTGSFLQVQERGLYRLQTRISQRPSGLISLHQQALQKGRHEVFAIANKAITAAGHDLAIQKHRISTWSGLRLKNADTALRYLGTSIRLMSPEQILQKGFALIRVEGAIVVDPAQIAEGQPIEIITSKVTLEATVNTKKENTDGRAFKL